MGVGAEENQEHMVSRKPREENVLKVDKSIEYYGNSNHEKCVGFNDTEPRPTLKSFSIILIHLLFLTGNHNIHLSLQYYYMWKLNFNLYLCLPMYLENYSQFTN